ncbi:MAG: hypothetical protein Q4D79_07055 [Propionibacteriaceae bacterium]|nr:hypothetical protein [Propionibacteriaceae bacterium]
MRRLSPKSILVDYLTGARQLGVAALATMGVTLWGSQRQWMGWLLIAVLAAQLAGPS